MSAERVLGGILDILVDVVRKALPYDIYKDIQDAVALLHSKNLVFCDLRTPNVMVVPGGPGSDA